MIGVKIFSVNLAVLEARVINIVVGESRKRNIDVVQVLLVRIIESDLESVIPNIRELTAPGV